MSVRKATKGNEFGDGLAWLWLSLGLTGLPSARLVLFPQDLGIAGAALDMILFAVFVLALVMLGASVVLIFLSLHVLRAGPSRRASRRALFAALLPAIGALYVASRLEPAYAPAAAAAALAMGIGAATNAAFESFAARPRRPQGSEANARGRPGTHG